MKLFFRITFIICLLLAILSGCEYSQYYQGTKLLEKGQYDQAITYFDKAIEINPRYAEAYNNRGIAYLKKGQYDKAISDFTEAIEINPKDAMAYRNRGIAYAMIRQHDKFSSNLNKAIELDPTYDMKALVEKNEDVLSVIAKSVDFSQPEVSKEIYTDNAILKHEDGQTGRMHKFKGFKEIENWRKERGKKWHRTELFLKSIEREADKAHVKCGVIVTDVENSAEWINLSCSTKMLKIGSTWKIKEQIIKNKTK
jgi:tetratricopeptide (TPR) repeat protein